MKNKMQYTTSNNTTYEIEISDSEYIAYKNGKRITHAVSEPELQNKLELLSMFGHSKETTKKYLGE